MGLFLLFFSAIGSYIGWSSRHFLMIPTLQFESDIPEDARREASRWHDDQDFFKPEKFSWSRMVHYLQYPWDKGPSPIKVRLVQDDLILSVFIHHASRGSDGVELSKADDRWLEPREINIADVHHRELLCLRRAGVKKEQRAMRDLKLLPMNWQDDF